MSQKQRKPEPDASSAPESGTVRDDTTGSPPADRADQADADRKKEPDDPGTAGEER